VAQVGRISGPLLEANLERNGIDLAFRNDLDTVQLLYLDVNSGRIAINRDVAAADLDVINTTIRTVNLIGDTAPIANYTFSTNNIDVSTGDIFLNASEAIVLSNLETPNFFVSDNTIALKNNSNIELRPNGTGTLEIFNDLRVYGNLHATGDITLEGTITFGDTLVQDTVTFDVDVDSDIVPTTTDTYSLGSASKRWDNIYTLQVNGEEVTAGGANIGGIDLNKRLEYTLYVATNGDDANDGDHIQGPLASIQAAIAKIPSGTSDYYTIYVFPGTYAEQLPIVLPANATIAGNDIRNTIVVPAVGYEDSDVFHMNGQTTVQNLTVKNFYYDSVNNTGYAFRFAPNGVITSRSPYVQNVSVITQGSTTAVDDPRGFVIGDAGKGAYIDGAELSSSSFDASMLFHSVTMITPGVDAVTMTNGVRVEWLNSFTYFADRGLYAVNGATGRTSQDGSTINRGAEVRSIGSANVYGNYGAVADGADTLMYLILHNFAYIGTGKDFSNDSTLTIQANEVVKLNSGKIYYQSHNKGKLRIGDAFFVDLERGTTSVDLSTLTTNSLSGLVINTGTDTTTITGSKLETGNIRVGGNLIQSLAGDLNVVGATNEINLLDNTNINADLDIVGNFSFDGTLSLSGNEVTDGLRFNVELEQNFNPNQHLTFSLGTSNKQWLAAYLNRLEVGDVSIYDNAIETNVTNSDLELRANGTGLIYIPDSATFSNALDVNGTSGLNNVVIQGDLNLTGVLTQTGNINISDNLAVSQNITVGAAAQFEEILIDDNFITTTTSNTNLELRAVDSTSVITIQEVTSLQQNLSANDIFAQSDINVTLNISTDNAFIGNVEFNDNYIQTTGLNQSLTVLSAQNVTVTGNDVTLNQALIVSGDTDTQSVIVTGLIDHIGNRSQTGDYDIAGELFVNQLVIEDNFITFTTPDTSLILSADGLGTVIVSDNNVVINNNLTVLGLTDLQTTEITGLVTHSGNRIQTGNYNIAGEFTNGNILIEDNFITTTTSNSDLELRANGTGTILVPNNNVIITNDLDVSGVTDIQSVNIIGTLTHTGVRNQTGDYSQTGNLDITGTISVDSLAQFTDVGISGNTLTTTLANNDLILNADGNGLVIVQSDLEISNNLSARSIAVVGDIVIDQDLDLENISIPPSIIDIADNYISTKVSNADLELRANDIGSVVIDFNDVEINNNLTVIGSTDLQTLAITGPLAQTGNRTQIGVYTQTGNLTVDGSVTITDTAILDDIEVDQNILRSTSGNLVLTANGAGLVTFSSLLVEQNLTAGTLFAGNITIDDTLALEMLESSTDIQIFDNVITTTNSNSDLELRTNGTGDISLQDLKFNGSTVSTISANITISANDTVIVSATGALTVPTGTTAQRTDVLGDIRFNTADGVFEARGQTSTITFNGVYSNDRRTSVLAHPTNNTLLFTVNQTPVGTIAASGLTILHAVQTDDILVDANRISTTVSNSNLELRSDGTGELVIDNLSIKDNFIKNASTPIVIASTGFGYSKLETTVGVVVPTGTTAERPVPEDPPQLGDTRFNTSVEVLEVWDGSTYIAAAGTSSTISETEFNDLVLEYTLILG
jgi:hypothetical protein